MNVNRWFLSDDYDSYDEYRIRLLKLYRDFRTIWKAIRRPMDREHYGYFGEDADGNLVPKHANGKFRPHPILNRYTHHYEPAKLRMKDLIRCAYAEKTDDPPRFYFYVNKQNEIYPEMMIDIDATDEVGGDDDAGLIAEDIVQRIFQGHTTFTEHSRNGRGRYIRFIVERDFEPVNCSHQQRADAAKAFNRLMLLFGHILRTMHPKGQAKAHVDNVKALLFYMWKQFDDFTFYGSSELQDYEYSKSTNRFAYDANKERYHISRGVLGTIALSGAMTKASLERDPNRISRYLAFAEFKRQKITVNEIVVHRQIPLHRIPEAFFRDFVERHEHLLNLRETHTVASSQKSRTASGASAPSYYLCIGGKVSPTSLEVMKREPDSFKRTQWTVIEVFRLLGRTATVEECLAYYRAWGLDSSSHEDRSPSRFNDVIIWYTPIYQSGAGKRSVGFLTQWLQWQEVVQKHVTRELLEEAKKAQKCKNKITHLDLAIVLYQITSNTLKTVRPRSEWMFTTPEKAIFGIYRCLKEDGLSPTKCDKKKLRVIKNVLTQAGLIVPLYLNAKLESIASVERHIGQRYGLGVNHPQLVLFQTVYAEFQQAQEALEVSNSPIIDEAALEADACLETVSTEIIDLEELLLGR